MYSLSTTGSTRMVKGAQLPAHTARKQQVRVVLIGDLVATGYALAMGLWLREDSLFRGQATVTNQNHLLVAGIGIALLAIWNTALWTQGTRNFDVIGSGAREYWEVTRITGVVFAIVVTISYVFKLEIARGFVLFTFPVGLLLLLSWRLASNRNARRPGNIEKFTPRAIVLTQPGDGNEVWQELDAQFPNMRAVARVDIANLADGVEDVKAAALEHDADFIIVGPPLLQMPGLVRELAWALAGFDARIVTASPLLRRSEPQVTITRMWGQRMALVDDLRLTRAQRFKKRALDLTLTIAAMPLWVPLVLVLVVLVKLTSRGPAFFRQVRIGIDGTEFRIWKLRTMRRDADRQRVELATLIQSTHTGPAPRDPRVTAIGDALRKTSLDEVPQLLNVLAGSMSLVGPRPQVAAEVATYAPQDFRRLHVKPGLTGLWQISERGDQTWQESILGSGTAATARDTEYIHQWSLWLDFWILLRTVPEVVYRRGT